MIVRLLGALLLAGGLFALGMSSMSWKSLPELLLKPPSETVRGTEKVTAGGRRSARRWATLLGLPAGADEAMIRARVISAVLAAGGFLFMFLATGSPVMGGVGAVGFWIVPEALASRAIASRRVLLDRQQRTFFRRYKAARATRESAVQALDYAIRNTGDPLREVLERALSEYTHGGQTKLHEALAQVGRDIGSRDMGSFARIVRQDMETGGAVMKAIETVLGAMTMRDYAKRQKRIATAASKSGFLFVLPVPLVVILLERLFAPQFFHILKHTMGGQAVLAINGGLILVVVFLLRGVVLRGT